MHNGDQVRRRKALFLVGNRWMGEAIEFQFGNRTLGYSEFGKRSVQC
jgi:hypothetical protein